MPLVPPRVQRSRWGLSGPLSGWVPPQEGHVRAVPPERLVQGCGEHVLPGQVPGGIRRAAHPTCRQVTARTSPAAAVRPRDLLCSQAPTALGTTGLDCGPCCSTVAFPIAVALEGGGLLLRQPPSTCTAPRTWVGCPVTHEAQELSGSERLGTSGWTFVVSCPPLVGWCSDSHLPLTQGSPLMSTAHLQEGATT